MSGGYGWPAVFWGKRLVAAAPEVMQVCWLVALAWWLYKGLSTCFFGWSSNYPFFFRFTKMYTKLLHVVFQNREANFHVLPSGSWKNKKTDSVPRYDLLRKIVSCIPWERLRGLWRTQKRKRWNSCWWVRCSPHRSGYKSSLADGDSFLHLSPLRYSKSSRWTSHVWTFPKSQSTRTHSSQFASLSSTKTSIISTDVGLESK